MNLEIGTVDSGRRGGWRRLSLFAIALAFALIGSLTSSALPAGAAEITGPVRPDKCFAINPGSPDVTITIVPSKLNITRGTAQNPAPNGDNAEYYEMRRSDGRFLAPDRANGNTTPRFFKNSSNPLFQNDRLNTHDRDSGQTRFGYEVRAVRADGATSNWTDCPGFDAVSSISPGRLVDFRRGAATVSHGLGNGAVGATPRQFTGVNNDIVTTLVTAADGDALSPAGKNFAFGAEVTLTAAQINKIKNALPERYSWNVMQRGLADDPGGQWKMSIVGETGSGEVAAQCVGRDGQGGLLRVNSTYKLVASTKATITCFVDDRANTIQIVVNGRTDSVVGPVGGGSFGNINPSAPQNCLGKYPGGVGNVIAVGNKVLCGGNLTPDDRFEGTVGLARVFAG